MTWSVAVINNEFWFIGPKRKMISVEKINEPKVIELLVELDKEAINGLSKELSGEVPRSDCRYVPDLVEAILNACKS